MPDYSANEIEAIGSRLLDFFLKTEVKDSVTFDKPTMKKMVAKRKSFGATKGKISAPVRLAHGNAGTNDGLKGIGPGDQLDFYNPSNERRAEVERRKMHMGIQVTEDQLEDAGIRVTDNRRQPSGGGTDVHPVLISTLTSTYGDLNEQWDEKFNSLLWGDGTADPKALAGLRSIILDDPTQGTVCGLSGGLNADWRNRAYTAAHAASGGTGAITSNVAAGGELMQILQKDNRQLMRFGSKADMRPSGSDFMDALEREMRANGQYFQTGAGGGDIEVKKLNLGGIEFYYDPELDNIGRAKYSYAFDSRDICLYVREGLWKQERTPSRPYDRFVFHHSVVTTCNLLTDKRNGSAVYQIT